MKYVYPVVFTPEDNQILVSVPDLSGCHTFGNELLDAIEMARDAMSMWLCEAEDNHEDVPVPSQFDLMQPETGFVNLIDVDTTEYRRLNDNRAVKKTLTLPSWLNAKAEMSGINFSQVLQEALKEKLHVG